MASGKGAPFYRWMDAFPDGTPPPPLDFDEENTRLAEAGLRLLWRTNPDLRVDEVTNLWWIVAFQALAVERGVY